MENGNGGSVSLSRAPKTLHELYTEWQFGIGGENLLDCGIRKKELNELAV
jgi:hypothetical protein